MKERPMPTDPCDIAFFRLLTGSYARLTGKSLVPAELDAEAGAKWLYEEAPFGLLAHDTNGEPIFIYGNKRSQNLLGYDWDELTSLPSRLSAETPERGARQALLEQVSRDGYITGYRGVRIAKSGTKFWIEDATVWQLIDEDDVCHGQAAMIPDMTYLATESTPSSA
jgi:PAS domain S-box-containing protein